MRTRFRSRDSPSGLEASLAILGLDRTVASDHETADEVQIGSAGKRGRRFAPCENALGREHDGADPNAEIREPPEPNPKARRSVSPCELDAIRREPQLVADRPGRRSSWPWRARAPHRMVAEPEGANRISAYSARAVRASIASGPQPGTCRAPDSARRASNPAASASARAVPQLASNSPVSK